MTQTIAEKTLLGMRLEVAGDSRLYGPRLHGEDEIRGGPGFSDLLAAAPYRLGLEYIFEGYLLHYGQSRLLKPDSKEFELLAGDYMYARGLSHIASLEDLFCIEALADLLRFCSYVHCEGLDPSLALNAWAITTLLIAGHAGCVIPAGGFGENAGSFRPDLCGIVWADEDAGNSGAARLEALITELLGPLKNGGANPAEGFAENGGANVRELLNDILTNFRPEV